MDKPTTTEFAALFPGDVVTIKDMYRTRAMAPDAQYRVEAIPGGRRTNYDIIALATGARIKAPIDALDKVEGATATPAEPVKRYTPGTVVRAKAAGGLPGGLYAVLQMNAAGQYKIAPLGGDERGRMWERIPRELLTEVDITALVEANR
jgi:hypothetical protein